MGRWVTRGIEVLWLLTLRLVPLAFAIPGIMSNGYDVPKVTLYRSLVGLMGALWIIQWGLNLRPIQNQVPRPSWSKARQWLRGQPTRWLIPAAIFMLASSLISTLLSPSIPISLWGGEPAQEGSGFYSTLNHYVLFMVVAIHVKTSAQLWRLLGAIVGGGAVVAGYGVLQNFGLDAFGYLKDCLMMTRCYGRDAPETVSTNP